ncbi:DsrE family protein [Pedobacter immunditicola]|uniref:DsrE family protein n=1 Tax=Pedobacter immunditicola TaxID=3133440 RepID=UPI0030A2023F
MMRPCYLIICAAMLLFYINPVKGQNKATTFKGAKANKSHYKALYILNSGEDKRISSTLRNINNALEDPRLKGKLEVELIVFGDGVAVFKKDGKYLENLTTLKNKGVLLAQCENTLRERNINKDELFDFIHFVPSGNGEVIIRQQQGWSVIHP